MYIRRSVLERHRKYKRSLGLSRRFHCHRGLTADTYSWHPCRQPALWGVLYIVLCTTVGLCVGKLHESIVRQNKCRARYKKMVDICNWSFRPMSDLVQQRSCIVLTDEVHPRIVATTRFCSVPPHALGYTHFYRPDGLSSHTLWLSTIHAFQTARSKRSWRRRCSSTTPP